MALLLAVLLLCGCMPENSQAEPVRIAIIDTGLSSAAISPEKIGQGKNYLDPEASTEDTYGHGTAVASVILANYPQAQLVPLVSNAYDNGKIRQVDNDMFAQMIRDAVDVYHCRIINLSVGLILDKPSIREAVAYAEEKGVLVVASVGNDYAADGDFKYYPAGYDTVLAVGSVNSDHSAISAFSQRGEWVDVYAVGEDVTIATLSGNTRQSQGTSYSAARVTAYAANLLEQNPACSPAQLREKLLAGADTLPDGRKYIP
jgi:hypothetical protein